MAITQQLAVILTAQDQTKGALTSLNNSLNNLAKAAAGFIAAFAAKETFQDIIESTARLGSEVDLLRDNLGISAQEASRLNYAARVVGSSAEEVSASFGALNRKLIDQLPLIAQGKDDFTKFGVAVHDAQGNIVSFPELINNVRNRLRELPAGLERSGVAMDLMGRSGRQLLDLMTLTDAQFKSLADEATDFGLVLSDAGVDNLEDFQRNLNRMNLQLDGMKLQIGQFLIPIMNAALQWIRGLAGGFKVLGEAMRVPLGIVKQVIDRLTTFVGQIKEQGFVTALTNLVKDVLDRIGNIFGDIGQWFSENWPGILVELGKLARNFGNWFITEFAPAVLNGLRTAIPHFGTWVREVIEFFINAAVGIYVTGREIGTQIVYGIMDGLRDNWPDLLSWWLDVLSQLPIVGPPINVIRNLTGGSGGSGGGGISDQRKGEQGASNMVQPNCAPGFIAIKWADGHWTCEPSGNNAGTRGYASGGFVPNTGMAFLHAGETVIPAGGDGGGWSGDININVTATAIGNERAMQDFAEMISDHVGTVLMRKTLHNRNLAY